MALSRGSKIALGCGLAFILAAGVVVVALVGAAWWGVGKAKQVAREFEADTKGVEEALARANANPFTAPADGVIAEDRLVRFLNVRKKMYRVYAKHKDMIEAQGRKKDPDITALASLPGIIMQLRAAKAEALAEQAMSESEFSWMFGAVYRNLVVAGITKEGGEGASEALRQAGGEMAEQAEQAARNAEADPNIPPEAARQLREAAGTIHEHMKGAAETARSLNVPPANMALFKKHRDEILQYTMGGLELLPL